MPSMANAKRVMRHDVKMAMHAYFVRKMLMPDLQSHTLYRKLDDDSKACGSIYCIEVSCFPRISDDIKRMDTMMVSHFTTNL